TLREMNSMMPRMAPSGDAMWATTELELESSFSGDSGADAQWRRQLAQRGDDRECDDPAGFGILRRHVLDRQREARAVRIDLDDVAIARHGRVGPDVDHGAVRPDARERQRGNDIDVGGKAGGGIARGAAED